MFNQIGDKPKVNSNKCDKQTTPNFATRLALSSVFGPNYVVPDEVCIPLKLPEKKTMDAFDGALYPICPNATKKQEKEKATMPISKEKSEVLKIAKELLDEKINEGDGSYLKLTQGRAESWCADTVNYVYEKAYGRNIFGPRDNTLRYKAYVKELKKWGQDNKCFVETTKVINNKKFTDPELAKKAIMQMKPGDLPVFDCYRNILVDGKPQTRTTSHIGIVKEIKDNKIQIYEGNANYYKSDSQGGYLYVHNASQGKAGNQNIGELQEVLDDDAFLLKEYDVDALVKAGFSGYIKIE